MTIRLRSALAFALAILAASCSGYPSDQEPLISADTGPRYIFLFIGDGMGKAHVESAEAALRASEGRGLSFAAFPVQGSLGTKSLSLGATDSAAAATALATGRKTANGVLGMDPSGREIYETLADLSRATGRSVGIISSVSLNHATPAGFYAASPSRSLYHSIGIQLAQSGFEYLAGGGLLENEDPAGSGPSLLDIFSLAGYSIADTKAEFDALSPSSGKILAFGDPLDHGSSLPYEAQMPSGGLRLADLAGKGIELLSHDPEGFFMMIEGGKIDWASHDGDLELARAEVRGMDAAVDRALDFMEAHPGDCLVVVTADHETGKLAADGMGGYAFASSSHSSARVGVYALGLGEELFSGDYENTGIFFRIKALIEAPHAP
ncbi:MAG TPA: alkaline phosphatase [Rectinemataceae bacterium]